MHEAFKFIYRNIWAYGKLKLFGWIKQNYLKSCGIIENGNDSKWNSMQFDLYLENQVSSKRAKHFGYILWLKSVILTNNIFQVILIRCGTKTNSNFFYLFQIFTEIYPSHKCDCFKCIVEIHINE